MTHLKTAHILVVEDNQQDVELLRRFFKQEKIGNRLSVATSIHQAREYLKLHDYDIALIDAVLPDGGGLELARYINPHATSIVMLSGLKDDAMVKRAANLGAEAFIEKPITRHNLDLLVQSLEHVYWALAVEESN